MSGLATNIVSTFLGTACVIAGVFSVAYKMVFRSMMSRMSDPWQGLAWVQGSRSLAPLAVWADRVSDVKEHPDLLVEVCPKASGGPCCMAGMVWGPLSIQTCIP